MTTATLGPVRLARRRRGPHLGTGNVAKLDANGNHVWSKRFGDAADQSGSALAIDGQGNVILGGTFAGKVGFGSGDLVSEGGDDIFVTKLAP